MMVVAIEGVLVFLVLIGSVTIVWGSRQFQLPSKVMAIAFAITAASWVALLVTTISITVRSLAIPSA